MGLNCFRQSEAVFVFQIISPPTHGSLTEVPLQSSEANPLVVEVARQPGKNTPVVEVLVDCFRCRDLLPTKELIPGLRADGPLYVDLRRTLKGLFGAFRPSTINSIEWSKIVAEAAEPLSNLCNL